ncbi:MAG: hypothetical protein LBI49_18485 [Nocardiopsaceae bacterium]|nr:hypothetical protein [Nocardiopsaceae bacterium]
MESTSEHPLSQPRVVRGPWSGAFVAAVLAKFEAGGELGEKAGQGGAVTGRENVEQAGLGTEQVHVVMAAERGAGPRRSERQRLPRVARVLAGGSFVNCLGNFAVPFLVPYLIQRGYGAGLAAGAVSAYAAGKIAAGLAGGLLTDRIGARVTTAGSMAGSAVATLHPGATAAREMPYSQPASRAMRMASMRLWAPILLMALDR